MSEEGKEAASVSSVPSEQEAIEEEVDEHEAETEHEAGTDHGTVVTEEPAPLDGISLEMTESMKSITEDVMPPLGNEVVPRFTADTEDTLLKNALQAVRKNFTEAKVLSEIRKMYDKYQESQISNELLSKQCSRHLEKLEAYDLRHRKDPRVMKALKLAEKHRSHAKAADEQIAELENELLEARDELKHQEEMLKSKSKEISKLSEEMRKLKDIERHAESLENQLMVKGAEIVTLRDSHEMEIKALNTQRLNEIVEIQAKHAEEKMNESAVVHDTVKKDFSHNEKLALMKDLREKQKYIKLADDDRKMLKILVQTCQDKRQNITYQLNKYRNLNKKLRKASTLSSYEKDSWKQKSENTRRELEKTGAKLQECLGKIDSLQLMEKQLMREKQQLKSQLKGVKSDLDHTKSVLLQCNLMASNMKTDLESKKQEILNLKHELNSQQIQNDSLLMKVNDLERKRAKQTDLFHLSEANALVLGKELTNLNAECQRQKKAVLECKDEKQKLHSRMCTLTNHYVELAGKNQVLVREKEIQEVYAAHAEEEKEEAVEKMQTLIKTNIELYSETTTQQEIAMFQNYQFKVKEQELKALQSSQGESHSKLETQEHYMRVMHSQIDELNENLMDLHQKIKEQKHQIIALEMDNASLAAAFVKSEEKGSKYAVDLSLFRRQRDVLGAKLIQSQNELLLVEKKYKLLEQVILTSTVDHRNLKNDVYVLRLEIKNLRRTLKCQEGSSNLISVLRQELSKTAKSLELEKARNCALASTRNPKIHRWRALLAADPSKFELHLKIHHLTRRLIDKTTEVVEKEQLITNMDLYYMELRTLVERRMTPALSSEMSMAKATIKKQKRQLQAVTAELNMSYDDVSRQEIEANKKQAKVDELRKKMNEEKRISHRLLKQCQAKLPPIQPNKAGPQVGRGGYLYHTPLEPKTTSIATSTSAVRFLDKSVILRGTSANSL